MLSSVNPSDGQHLIAVEGLTGKQVLRLAEKDQPPWSPEVMPERHVLFDKTHEFQIFTLFILFFVFRFSH
jgi:hypothetical protein